LNVSNDLPIRGLTVTAILQTPSGRFSLPSKLDPSNNSRGMTVAPLAALDVIVSRVLEEVGEHILRVEVVYGGGKKMRKFYRFNVASPLHIRELTIRGGDGCCFVSIAIENATVATTLTITGANFHPPSGIIAEKIGGPSFPTKAPTAEGEFPSAIELLDACGRLEPQASFRYLFLVKTKSEDATLRGLACGDELGKAAFSWRKSFGEVGRIASTSVFCPSTFPPKDVNKTSNVMEMILNPKGSFVVHGSGLSVDVAAAAANPAVAEEGNGLALDEILPVTVEPIDPPSTLALCVPQEVQLLVVNHSNVEMDLQIQMRLPGMIGVVVCGQSFKNLGIVKPNGGSTIVNINLVALVAGLFRVQGCWVIDLGSGREIAQPPLFSVFVEKD